jgi:hypothetical protein
MCLGMWGCIRGILTPGRDRAVDCPLNSRRQRNAATPHLGRDARCVRVALPVIDGPQPLYAAVVTDPETTTNAYIIEGLGPDTWDAFADLAERHNGVGGGWWCTWFHTAYAEKTHSAEGNRALKERLVHEAERTPRSCSTATSRRVVRVRRAGGAAEPVPPKGVRSRARPAPRLPDHLLLRRPALPTPGRRAVALRGALDLIAQAGGGVVEAYPQDTEGRKISASFLYNGTRTLFEDASFHYDRPKGKNHTVMSTTVAPTS